MDDESDRPAVELISTGRTTFNDSDGRRFPSIEVIEGTLMGVIDGVILRRMLIQSIARGLIEGIRKD